MNEDKGKLVDDDTEQQQKTTKITTEYAFGKNFLTLPPSSTDTRNIIKNKLINFFLIAQILKLKQKMCSGQASNAYRV